MEKKLHISTTFDQATFLEELVEKLAWRRFDLGYSDAKVPAFLEPLDISTTETYAGGTTAIEASGEQINMPFITRFLFTCVKSKKGNYKLAWSTSLS
jgi:hypothetical protein